MIIFCAQSEASIPWVVELIPEYSKHPDIRTHDFGGQADWVLIYRVLNDKSDHI